MSFSPNIPTVSDFLAISQKQMLANFQAISSAFFQDHVSLVSNENLGMHNQLTLVAQSGDPTTSSSQCALYNKLVSSVPQLFFRPSSNGTPVQLSNSNLNTIQTGAANSAQSTFIAGPFTIYFGFISNCANNFVVTLTPSSTLIYVGLTTMLAGKNVPGLASTSAAVAISANQFTVSYNSTQFTTNPTIYYLAVGI